jgi:hypothetical protein
LDLVEVHTVAEAVVAIRQIQRSACKQIGLIFNGSTLAQLICESKVADCVELQELHSSVDALVYGFPEASVDANRLNAFLGINFELRTRPLAAGKTDYRFEVDRGTSPLAGLGFTHHVDTNSSVFEESGLPSRFARLISANEAPLLISLRNGEKTDLLLSTSQTVDLDAPCIPPAISSECYSGLLPVAFALRYLFGAACWNNPYPGACVIIDDPLLQPRYGFFNFQEVIGELNAHQYTTTVAFIPCNSRRSNPEVVRELLGNAERISICVHGCYHTEAEFADIDQVALQNKSAMALEFMREHASITSLPFDRAMVFPQGAFSSASLIALKNNGYIAAVNTGIHPLDHPDIPVSISDLFGLAQTRYSDLPLFSRRYPTDVFDFAVDLFWGKPLLVVEHHDYFRKGPARMSEFVRDLNALDRRIEWLTLEKTVTRAALYRSVSDHSYAVRFATAIFQLRNPQKETCLFECWKQENDPHDILDLTINGSSNAYKWQNGGVLITIEMEANGVRNLEVVYRPRTPVRGKLPLSYKLRALGRRRLSEFRDNHLSGSEWTMRLVRKLKESLLG